MKTKVLYLACPKDAQKESQTDETKTYFILLFYPGYTRVPIWDEYHLKKVQLLEVYFTLNEKEINQGRGSPTARRYHQETWGQGNIFIIFT